MENSASVALCVVAGGEIYERYAKELRVSFYKYFFPSSKQAHFYIIKGAEGWPDGTMYRWHRLLENMPETDYVFLCDADMRFESTVGQEIVEDAITLTLHPGYVGLPAAHLPYERRLASCCSVRFGDRYFAGGFAGGPRKQLKRFANEIVTRIDRDMSQGVVPRWHDESALNKVATVWDESFNVLNPSYCYPDNDSHYRANIWKEQYERKLVALDKSADERQGR